jgi:hypothetical protein
VAKEAQKAIDSVKSASEKAISQMKTFVDTTKDGIKKSAKETQKKT